MKKIKLSFLGMLLLGAVACTKNTSNVPAMNSNVSNAEAADMVAGSVSLNSNGVANVATDVSVSANVFVGAHLTCGTTKADSISRKSTTGSSVTYSYNLKYNYTLKCDANNNPDSLSSSLIYSGSFNGPNLSSTNSGSSIFTVGELSSSSADFVINGEYKRSGSFQSKIDTTNAGNNNVDIVVNGLTVKKIGQTIVSGNASISVSGNVPKKGSFSYTGTLVFNADNTATLTLNGVVYTINMVTGQRMKK